VDDDNNLDIFQVTTRSIEPTKDLVSFSVLLNGCEGDQVSFSMEGQT
jgi:hypothetical protein